MVAVAQTLAASAWAQGLTASQASPPPHASQGPIDSIALYSLVLSQSCSFPRAWQAHAVGMNPARLEGTATS